MGNDAVSLQLSLHKLSIAAGIVISTKVSILLIMLIIYDLPTQWPLISLSSPLPHPVYSSLKTQQRLRVIFPLTFREILFLATEGQREWSQGDDTRLDCRNIIYQRQYFSGLHTVLLKLIKEKDILLIVFFFI